MTSWINPQKRLLFIDIETYSETDLKECGVYRYCEDPAFEVDLLGYAYGEEKVKVLDLLQGEQIPEELLKDLTDPDVIKIAHNANFERTCLTKWLDTDMDPAQWYCTAVRAATLGLPRSLEGVGEALGLAEDEKKMAVGKRLIQYFAKPCAPTKTNGGRRRNLPHHEPEKWKIYKDYNGRDVETERTIFYKMQAFPEVSEEEHRLWELDQRMNAAGVEIDVDLVQAIIGYSEQHSVELQEEAKQISRLENPSSIKQAMLWLRQNGVPVQSFNKDTVADLVKTVTDPAVLRFLQIRQELGKTSVTKYDAMSRARCEDNKVRGMLQFYGANRTGRWAGRIVQLQNLPQNKLNDLDLARTIVKNKDFELLELLYDSTMDVFSQLIRTAFIAGDGKLFAVADYSAIEARVIAWLAGEEWRLDAFKHGQDIYCASASQMFGVPVKKNGINGHLRKKGKVAELACIAEGTLIQTDRRGLVPIEDLTELDRVFDGEQYVSHGGVLYKGTKEVIAYDGLSATTDHLVWVEGQAEPVPFGIAARSHAHLLRPGDSRTNLWKSKNRFGRKDLHETENKEGLRVTVCDDGVPVLWEAGVDPAPEPDAWAIVRVPALHADPTGSEMALQEGDRSEAEMREPERQGLSKLRRARDTVQLPERSGGRPLDHGEPRTTSGDGARPDRQRWELRAGKPPVPDTHGQQREQAVNGDARMESGRMAIREIGGDQNDQRRDDERRNHRIGEASGPIQAEELAGNQKTVRVYDILDCGPNNRYLANGALVHNCGYQGGIGAMKRMGGEDMGLTDEEMQEIVDNWRAKSPKIVELWATTEKCAKEAILHPGTVQRFSKGLAFKMIGPHLFARLPSGRLLCYNNARIAKGQMRTEIKYMGQNQTTQKWEEVNTYGGKLVENLTQATARDCLGCAMLRLADKNLMPSFHIHDEVVIPISTENAEETLKTIEDIMALDGIPWKEGLPLKADGYLTYYYKKD